MTAASIRYKNPGAMWGSALTKKWGADPNAITLHDGKGQGNNIAVFPTFVQGICAQIDLWRTSAHYKNKPFAVGIATWSGGNSVESYVRLVTKRVPGMTRDTVMNDAFWHSGMAIPFLKAQAFHEAGQEYPAPEEDWVKARNLVLGGHVEAKPSTEPPVPRTAPPKKSLPPHTEKVAAVGVFASALMYLKDHRLAVVAVGLAVALGVFLWNKYKK